MQSDSDPLKDLRDDRYVNFKATGQGGMGIVYLAVDTVLNREVAFKIMRPHGRDQAGYTPTTPVEVEPPTGSGSDRYAEHEQRFLQEARVTGLMEHPGIVPVYELGRTPNRVPYYTMRFVRGNRTLEKELEASRVQELGERLSLIETLLKVGDTLHYAHEQGVIHRDLKPANIALGDFGEVVVLDWGLAKLRQREDLVETLFAQRIEQYQSTDDLQTATGILGTPGYMSPEAAQGRIDEVDARSDVYSMGVVLYEVLTGKRPFEFRTFAEYVGRVSTQDVVPPAHVDPAVPEALSGVCVAALSRDPRERPASAGEFVDAVRAWQAADRLGKEIDALSREARSALDGAEGLQGGELLRQLERARAPSHRILQLDPGNSRSIARLKRIEELSDRGLVERDAATRRQLLKRVSIAALAVIAVGAVIIGNVLAAGKREAERQREDAQKARNSARESLAHAYAELSNALFHGQRHAAAHLAAAESLSIGKTREGWAALSIAAQRQFPTFQPLGAGFLALCAAFSKDEETLFVGCADGKIRAWDVTTGRNVLEMQAHESEIRAIAVDGKHLYTGGDSGGISLIRVWNLETLRVVDTIEGFTGLVLDVELKGHLLYALDAGGSESGSPYEDPYGSTVHVWDLEKHEHAWRIEGLSGSRDPLLESFRSRAICISDDGEHLFVGATGAVTIWSTRQRRPIQTIDVGAGIVSSVALSPDGDELFVGFRVEADAVPPVQVWDWRSARLAGTLEGREGGVRSLVTSPDGRYLFAASNRDPLVLRWDLTKRSNPEPVEGAVPLAVSRTRSRLVTSHPDHALRLLDVQTLDEATAVAAGHQGAVMRIAYCRERDWVLSLDALGVVRFWDAGRGTPAREAHRSHSETPRLITLIPGRGGEYVCASSGRVWIASIDSGSELRSVGKMSNTITALVVSGDGKRLYAGNDLGVIRGWELTKETKEPFFVATQDRPVTALGLNGKGQIFSGTGRWSGMPLHVLHFEQHPPVPVGEPTKEPPKPQKWKFPEGTHSASIEPHERRVGGDTFVILALDAESGELVARLEGHTAPANVLVCSGNRLFSGAADRQVRIWDTQTASTLRVLKDHSGPVSCLALSADAEILVSGCSSPLASGSRLPSVRVWQVETGALIHALDGHDGWVSGVAYSADGTLFSAGRVDRAVYKWSFDRGRPRVSEITARGGMGAPSATFNLALSPDGSDLYVASGAVGGVFAGAYESFGRTATYRFDLGSGAPAEEVKGSEVSSGACSAVDGRAILVSSDGRRLYEGAWAADAASACDPVPVEGLDTPAAGPVLVGVVDLAKKGAASGLYLDVGADSDVVLDLATLRDGSRLYAGGRGGNTYEFNLSRDELQRTFEGEWGPVACLTLSEDERELITGTRRGAIVRWDLASAQPTVWPNAHTGGIGAIAVSIDGKRIYSAGGGRGVPDEKSPVLRTTDTLIKIWDRASGRVIRTMEGHESYVEALVVSGDGSMLLSGSRDGTVRIWNAELGSEIAILDAGIGAIRDVVADPDGVTIFTGGHAPRVHEWDLGLFLQDSGERRGRLEAETRLTLDAGATEVRRVLWNDLR